MAPLASYNVSCIIQQTQGFAKMSYHHHDFKADRREREDDSATDDRTCKRLVMVIGAIWGISVASGIHAFMQLPA